MKMCFNLLLVIMLGLTTACSSVTVRTDEARKESMKTPTFQKRYTYWWWGLKGEHTINVREVCVGKPAEQIQAVFTIVDFLGAMITLGIYSPRTAKIWCEGK